jgi:hypothetical protein
MRSLELFLFAIVAAVAQAATPTASWDPPRLAREDTIEFLTVGPDEGEHWSRVWVVAVDDKLDLRLGRRAAARIERNTMAPFVKVRIAGEEFYKVRAEPAPEMAERVAAAMAEKYRSDLVVRFMNHPLTVRLVLSRSPRRAPDQKTLLRERRRGGAATHRNLEGAEQSAQWRILRNK